MSIEVSSAMSIQRNGNNQVINVDYELDKKALKQEDGNRFLTLFSLHNAADDSLIKHLGADELNISQINSPDIKLNFSISLQDDILDVNKGVSRSGKDIVNESVYVRLRVFKIDNDPVGTVKSNVLTGAFGPQGMFINPPIIKPPVIIN